MVFLLSFMLNQLQLKKMIKNNHYLFLILNVLLLFSLKVIGQTYTVLSYDNYLNNVLENNPIAKRAENIKEYG